MSASTREVTPAVSSSQNERGEMVSEELGAKESHVSELVPGFSQPAATGSNMDWVGRMSRIYVGFVSNKPCHLSENLSEKDGMKKQRIVVGEGQRSIIIVMRIFNISVPLRKRTEVRVLSGAE